MINSSRLVNPKKPGKVRRISNAKEKANGGCLIDKLFRGPDLLGSLFGILFRCREKPRLIMADIESIFMKVGVRAQGCRYLRFLWANSENGEAEVLRVSEEYF